MGLVLSLAFLVLEVLRANRLRWVLVVSGIVAGMAISLILGNTLVMGQ